MKRMLVLGLVVILCISGVQAQDVAPLPDAEINPDANISWPPPVYVVRGELAIRGSANLPDMTNYFIEYRPLLEALTAATMDVPWLPATLPRSEAVVDGVLGVWDTTSEADGLYELRLVVNHVGSVPEIFEVRPLRVENEPSPFAQVTPVATTNPIPTIAPTQPAEPAAPTSTLQPTPTAFDPTPRVTPNLNASINVRSGDGTGYSAIGFLEPGETAQIIGRSSSGSGWFYIELNSGQRGWVAGGVVQVLGNTAGLPLIDPPATPTPVATATPNLPDATIVGVRYDRGEIRQGEDFQIIVRARNNSGVFLPETTMLCTVKPQGREVSANVGGLNAFEERDVVMSLRLDSGGGSNVTVDCAIDVNNFVQETNDANNYFSITTPLLAP